MLKYVLISKDILYDAELCIHEKVILSLIASFNSNEKKFYCTNEQISEILNCSVSTVRRAIRSLEKKNYIYSEYYKSGMKRAIYPNFIFN